MLNRDYLETLQVKKKDDGKPYISVNGSPAHLTFLLDADISKLASEEELIKILQDDIDRMGENADNIILNYAEVNLYPNGTVDLQFAFGSNKMYFVQPFLRAETMAKEEDILAHKMMDAFERTDDEKMNQIFDEFSKNFERTMDERYVAEFDEQRLEKIKEDVER